MTVLTLGPAGTFSHELAAALFGDDIELLPTIRAIIERVAGGSADGLVPIENSEAGGVGETLQGLMEFGVSITGEAYMPVRHHLAAREEPEHLQVIYAHPQTHEQCSILLGSLGVEVVHTSSNAASAVAMQGDSRAGAIIPEMAATIYGLPIVLGISRTIGRTPPGSCRYPPPLVATIGARSAASSWTPEPTGSDFSPRSSGSLPAAAST